MRFRIYFSVDGIDDSFVVEGKTIEEVRLSADKWLKSRGLTGDYVTGSDKIED